MIAPPFRQPGVSSPSFMEAVRDYIKTQKKGPQLDLVVANLAQAKSSADGVAGLVGSPSLADKGIPALINHYRNMKMLDGSIQFGAGKGQVRCFFKWSDPFSKENRSSYSAKFEQISTLYNIGVAYLHAGCGCDHNLIDGLKDASKYFQKAAWVFDYLTENLHLLTPSEFSATFTPQNIHFWRQISLGQAQACFYRVAEAKSMKPDTLLKIAKQASDFLEGAYNNTMTPPLSKFFDPAKVTNAVRFHHLFYLSKAYYKRFLIELESAKQKGEGYGLVVYYVRKAIEVMKTVKTFQKNLAPDLIQRAEAQISAMSQVGDEMEKKNNQVYCEAVPSSMKMAGQVLPAQSFVKPLSIEQELDQKSELSDSFKSIYPIEVTNLLQVYRKHVLSTIQGELGKLSQYEMELVSIMSAHNLPQSLMSFETANLPEDLWMEISRIQQSGSGSQGLMADFEKIKFLETSAIETLNQCDKIIQDDAIEDEKNRKQHGAKWTFAPTDVAAGKMVMSLSQHRSKLEQSGKVNDETDGMMKKAAQGLELLKLTRAQIEEKLASSQGGEEKLAGSPVVEAVGSAVQAAEEVQKERTQVSEELEKELSSEEILPELVEVIQKKRDQGATMDSWKGNFTARAQEKGGELASKYLTICMQLREQVGQFEKLKAEAMKDNPKMKFVQSLTEATKEFNRLSGRVRDGLIFYQAIVNNINMIYQEAQTFKAKRASEKSSFQAHITVNAGAPPPPVPYQAPPRGPPSPQAPPPQGGAFPSFHQPPPYQQPPPAFGGQPGYYIYQPNPYGAPQAPRPGYPQPGYQQGYPGYRPPQQPYPRPPGY